MRERIDLWWSGSEPRERLLIIIAACLTLLFALWFGVASPLITAKAEARRELTQAIDDKVLIDRALYSLQPAGQNITGPASDLDAFRSAISRSAQQRGLSITRLQSGAEGTLQLTFAEASPVEIYAWLEAIANMPGGMVVGASMISREEKVQAVIELQGTQS